jgi:hypothetical protein
MVTKLLSVLAVLGLGAFGALLGNVAAVDAVNNPPRETCPVPFHTDRAAIEKLYSYDDTLELTPRQQQLAAEALDRLPSFCMRGQSAASRCCGCNLGRATWGLAKYLLVVKGYSVQQVRAGVDAWQASVNPKGHGDHACPSAHCYLAFRENGCGGMHRDQPTY